MKEFLKKMLKKKEERKAELVTKANAAGSVEELRGINTEMEALNAEIAELRSEIDKLPDEVPAGGATPPAEGRQQVPATNGTNAYNATLAAFGMQSQQRSAETDDPYGTLEYRNAFKSFAMTGEIKPELRANATTTTSDISAVIPTTILKEVISKLTV